MILSLLCLYLDIMFLLSPIILIVLIVKLCKYEAFKTFIQIICGIGLGVFIIYFICNCLSI